MDSSTKGPFSNEAFEDDAPSPVYHIHPSFPEQPEPLHSALDGPKFDSYSNVRLSFSDDKSLVSGAGVGGKGGVAAVVDAAEALESEPGQYKVYKSRYYVLLVYSLVLFYQCMVWNTWGPISASALVAFPHWKEATIATFANWGPITFVLFVVPTSWAVARWGLRPVTVLFTGCVAVAHGLRCISTHETVFTAMAHLCGIMNGIEGTILLAGAMLPAMWYPAEQRITATALSSVFNQMGSGGSFLEPLLVRAPGNDTTREEILGDIHTLMFIELGIAVVLFLAVVAYFPSLPPSPPCPSSELPRYEFTKGFREIVRNHHFWQLVLPYALFTGVSMVWLGVINFSLAELDVTQDEAIWIGLYCSVSTGVVCLATSRLADLFYGYLKLALLVMMSVSSLFYIWFMLLTLEVIPSTKAQVYITVLGGQSFNFACTPLFYELCVEAVYPSSESGVGTIFTLLNNAVAALFLFLFYIPGISDGGNQWVTYVLVGSNVAALLPVMLVKEQYNRSKLDRSSLASTTTT